MCHIGDWVSKGSASLLFPFASFPLFGDFTCMGGFMRLASVTVQWWSL